MNKELIAYAESLTKPLPKGLESLDCYEIHCNFSGGKDSVAMALLLKYGYKVPKDRLKLVHMRVDGEKNNEAFFDWKETDEYLEYCSKILDLDLIIIAPEIGLKDRINLRGKFPSSTTQFCTSYCKRDVYSKWVRTLGPGKYLCTSGERAAESPRRANKPVFEVYKAANAPTKNRFVDWWRPIHHLKTDEVWKLLKLSNISPHPCYQYVSRCSCKFCIFLSPVEMKRVAELYPKEFAELIQMEKELGHTMKFEKGEPLSLLDFIRKGERIQEQISLDLECLGV